MMFDSFQPPYLPDDSSVSSGTSTQLSQNLALTNADAATHRSGANGRRSSQTTNILVASNGDQHRGLPVSRDVDSITTDVNSLPDTPTKNADAGTSKSGLRPLKIPDNISDTPATVISLLDSPTESGANETTLSINDPHSDKHHRQTATTTATTSSNALIDIPIPPIIILSDTTTDTRPSTPTNQNSLTNPTTREILDDLDLSMVVENPTDREPTILGTLTPIRRKQLRVMRCEHEELAILREVKKDNQNKGRKFFSCPRFETGEQCNYFRWEEAQYLPPRLPSHRPDYVPSFLRKSHDQNNSTLLSNEASKVSLVTTPVTKNSQSNLDVTSQQTQKTNTPDNDNPLEPTVEDMDPLWFLSAIEEEQARKSKDKRNKRDNGDNNDDNINDDSNMRNETPSAGTSQVSARNTVATDEPSRSSIPSSYDSWSQVPRLSTQQLMDVISNYARTQEQDNGENLERIRKERDQALDELKKAQEQISSLKRELERSTLMVNILGSQKRLLEIENEQLEDSNKRSKSR